LWRRPFSLSEDMLSRRPTWTFNSTVRSSSVQNLTLID
jgi:hypothetical protein